MNSSLIGFVSLKEPSPKAFVLDAIHKTWAYVELSCEFGWGPTIHSHSVDGQNLLTGELPQRMLLTATGWHHPQPFLRLASRARTSFSEGLLGNIAAASSCILVGGC